MRFKELIRTNSWLSIEIKLLDLYPDERENILTYEEVFSQLLILHETDYDMVIVLSKIESEDSINGYYVDVSGRKWNNSPDKFEITTSYAIEFTSWDKWLAMEIDQNTQKEFSELEIIAHCLYEMTFIGYDEHDIKVEFERINQIADDYKQMSSEEKAKLISLEELMKKYGLDTFDIRKAKLGEETILSELSFSSKSYWNYPPDYMKRWKPELTISGEYLSNNVVFVLESKNEILAYYSIVNLREPNVIGEIEIEKGTWLEHMFVRPDMIGKGLGKRLFMHMTDFCKMNSISEIKILSDPNSKGFYQKMGCKYIFEYPSTIKNRTTPYMIYKIK
jgi:GNAT superfamily N-acetyltransferase